MLDTGLPRAAVINKMVRYGIDSSILDLDPRKPLSSCQIAQHKTGPGQEVKSVVDNNKLEYYNQVDQLWELSAKDTGSGASSNSAIGVPLLGESKKKFEQVMRDDNVGFRPFFCQKCSEAAYQRW